MAVSARVCASVLLFGSVVAARADPLPRFPDGAVWNQDVSAATVRLDSATTLAAVQAKCGGDYSGCGFGLGRMQIDFSLRLVRAQPGDPTLQLSPRVDYYDPDCDTGSIAIPVPAGATIEGQAGMTCDFSSEDCHYLVLQGSTLYEVYGANKSGSNLQAQCLARWQLDAVYPPEGRGEHCTSADAAGFPMAPLLFNADEVYAATLVNGDIGHAIRFVMPNDKMASDLALEPDNDGKLYVRPATHAGGPDGLPGYIPYGSRLRLRSDFPLANYNAAAQVILRTLKRYGMVLADGGGVALTAEDDTYTTKKWADVGLDPNDGGSRVFDQTPNAQDVLITDFEIIDTGPRIAEDYNCVRAETPSPILFANGFESP